MIQSLWLKIRVQRPEKSEKLTLIQASSAVSTVAVV